MSPDLKLSRDLEDFIHGFVSKMFMLFFDFFENFFEKFSKKKFSKKSKISMNILETKPCINPGSTSDLDSPDHVRALASSPAYCFGSFS